MKDILPIVPPKMPRGRAISIGKMAAKIRRVSGINEDLLGPSDQFRDVMQKKENEQLTRVLPLSELGVHPPSWDMYQYPEETKRWIELQRECQELERKVKNAST